MTVSRSTVRGAVVVTAQGEVDLTSAPQLEVVLDEVVRDSSVPIVDLSGVSFLGSVGLSVLLAAAQKADPRRLRVVVSSPQVSRPITVTGLDKVLELFDTLDAALAQP
ncbi:anti-sigma factor antagonist [Nocardia yunnanensis]|uniref:Anti-sigma factor antagonist n=1 Tax=Nocardia yunnanensis TaxID=2382165 RepID=A0A386ZP43_9NOCA|nr:anti-sigma factor antagonist [Nocardia yunnanensis]